MSKTSETIYSRVWLKRLSFTLVSVGLVLAFPWLASSATGDLDPTFGNGGVVVTSITNAANLYDEPNAVLVQPDGKIVVSGLVHYSDDETGYPVSFFLARYNPTGTLDPSFGSNGLVLAPIGDSTGGAYAGENIAIQPDGKILTVGHVFWGGGSAVVVFRFNPDGTLDNTFGSGGRLITNIRNSAYDVAVQPDGEIVVIGTAYIPGQDNNFLVLRFHADGSPDLSFGQDGKVVTPVASGNIVDQAYTVALQPDGRIIAGGTSLFRNSTGYDLALVRYNQDGSIDSGFGTNGKVIQSINEHEIVSEVLVQPDGKIIVVADNGYGVAPSAIVRYQSNGSLDTSFGGGGIISPDRDFFSGHDIALQPDGKILAFGSGRIEENSFWVFAVMRLNANGSPDLGFGENGRILTPIGKNVGSGATAGALQADGKILAFGSVGNEDIAIVRYLGDNSAPGPSPTPTPIPTPAATPTPTLPPINGGVTNGKIAFAAYVDGNTDIFTVNPDGNGLQRLTFGPIGETSPVWSPDGTKILFNCDGRSCVMNADGSNLIRLNPTRGVLFESWSPDSQQLAGIRNGSIILIRADGTDLRQITDSFGYLKPLWSPDGSRIAASLQEEEGRSIFVMNLDGSDVRFVTEGWPFGWSPDGSRILLANLGVFTVNPDGSNLIRIGQPTSFEHYPFTYDWNPVWSPDGLKIAFARANCGDYACGGDYTSRILITDANGKNLAVSEAIVADYPAWSPDSTRIVFMNGSPTELFIMDVNGRTVASQLTGSQMVWYPSWQPIRSNQNPIDDPEFFVRQQYRDFLGREAETSGLNDWLRVLANCPNGDSECLHQSRLTVSAAFFGSPEFRLKGYFAFRFYRVALNRLPLYEEIIADMQSLNGQTPAEVYANRAAFANSFTQRAEFINKFASLSNADYVAALMNPYGLASVHTPAPTQSEDSNKITLSQTELTAQLNAGLLSRAQVLRAVADSDEVYQLEFNRAFVAMQYYGYLRRTPEPEGYNSWLNYLDAHPADFREMVRGFVDSTEYRRRFGAP